MSKNCYLKDIGKEDSYERNPSGANCGIALTGKVSIGRREETCKITEKSSTAWSNYRGFYSILGSLQYCPQYETDKELGT